MTASSLSALATEVRSLKSTTPIFYPAKEYIFKNGKLVPSSPPVAVFKPNSSTIRSKVENSGSIDLNTAINSSEFYKKRSLLEYEKANSGAITPTVVNPLKFNPFAFLGSLGSFNDDDISVVDTKTSIKRPLDTSSFNKHFESSTSLGEVPKVEEGEDLLKIMNTQNQVFINSFFGSINALDSRLQQIAKVLVQINSSLFSISKAISSRPLQAIEPKFEINPKIDFNPNISVPSPTVNVNPEIKVSPANVNINPEIKVSPATVNLTPNLNATLRIDSPVDISLPSSFTDYQSKRLDLATKTFNHYDEKMNFEKTSKTIYDFDGQAVTKISPRDAIITKAVTEARIATDENNISLDDMEFDVPEIPENLLADLFSFKMPYEIDREYFTKG